MNKIIKNTFAIAAALTLLYSCEKERGPLSDIIPENAVTVTNAKDFRPEPTVFVSKSAVVAPGVVGPIQIVLAIPGSSPRSIKEITKITASTSYTSIQSATSTSYIAAPIPGSGKTVTFNTTLTEYMTKTGTVTVPATNTELAQRFYFRITLDDNSIVYSEPVRVLVQD
jgi:hypothetical protein